MRPIGPATRVSKNIHIVSFKPKAEKRYVTLRIPSTQNMTQQFYEGAFVKWPNLLKTQNQSFNISAWQSISHGLQLGPGPNTTNSLKHALGALLGEGAADTVASFISRVFQGRVVHFYE